MKHYFSLAVALLLLCANTSAQSTRGIQDATRYIVLKDGQVIAIPEKHIISENESNGLCTLTLEGDTTFTYGTDNVERITSSYTPENLEVLSFSFTHDANDQVYKDVEATINAEGDTILISADVPVLGKRLRPTFALSEGATLWVDDQQQVSGQSSHRYTSPILYTLSPAKHWIYYYNEILDEASEWNAAPVDISDKASTNAPNARENQTFANLWDGNIATLYHSTWSDDGVNTILNWVDGGTYGDGVTEWPYIEIQLPEDMTALQFAYTTSNQNNRAPLGWSITALNSATNEWESLGTLNTTDHALPTTLLTSYTSPVYDFGGKTYTAVRFELTNAQRKNYLVLGEFGIYSCTAQQAEPTIEKGFKPMGRPCKVSVKYLTDHSTSEYNVPSIYITFGDGVTWDETQWIGQTLVDAEGNSYNTKEEWITGCTFRLDGAGIWPDIDTITDCEIRGRGNSSWTWSYRSKNPFRIKLPKKQKQSPFNLTKDRQWVFIANKQNGSMLTNSIAQKIAAMVDAEALCHMIPVDIYINGHYRGSYCFTEKIGISDNSVAIDEEKGALLEIDDYFDEVYRFRDVTYELPVNVKDPDLDEAAEEGWPITFDMIQTSINDLTATLYSGGDIASKIDMESWAKFWLVNDLVCNQETYHPKSCYLFNPDLTDDASLWKMGPCWDFDWAFGYERTYTYFINNADVDIFYNISDKAGKLFYDALRNTPAAKRAYYKEWVNFMAEGRLEELCEYIDDYTAFALPSIQHNNDAAISEMNYTDYVSQAELSKQWLRTRANYIFSNLETFDISPDIITPEDYGQPTEINETPADTEGILRPVDVYSISGVLLRRGVPYLHSTTGLTPGLYIVEGKTVAVK